ncbi:LuxR family transcriptional regulator [Aeromonas jandaei]|uniref:helix-turn-helix transcriptional regulator n=1 Tax=Aeromonas jandaei TaxID=650 RepID=UPI001C5AF31C|nr:LuxR family transcriptional regulator [Aeromonas jandaei]MBW3808202.1 LuxR family transcriptional regulator [Aeromonas jandaei]
MDNTIEFYLKNPIIKHDVGILLVKDSQHRFVASNNAFSVFSGFSPEKIIGLSDLDMPWSEQSKIYISHEKDILSGLSYSVIEPLPGIKKANLITQKTIIYNRLGIPQGTIATALPLDTDVEFGNLAGKSDAIKVVDYGLGLTTKESIVLYYALKGYKRTKVAEMAQMSTSSYDFHMRNLKEKFKADTTEQLKSIAYAQGLQDIMPFIIKR